jgi:hypothetical protein
MYVVECREILLFSALIMGGRFSWVKIEGKRMINRIISYGGLKNGQFAYYVPIVYPESPKFGTYSRGVRYYLGSLRTICVQRYHCKCCNSTFSNLSRIVTRLRRYAKRQCGTLSILNYGWGQVWENR